MAKSRPSSLLSRMLPRFDNSLENPRVSLNDPRAWDELFGLNLSDPGVRVTPQVAIGYAPLFRAISLICNAVMRSPMAPYAVAAHESSVIDESHPAFYMLHWKANELQTAARWRETMQFHALLRGNGYSAILRDNSGRPRELLPLSPTDTHPVYEGGRLVYATKARDVKRKIPPEDMFHLAGLSWDGLVGLDILTVMKDELGEGIAQRKFAAKFFSNGASIGGVLMTPRGMPEAAAKQVKKDWKDYQEGLDNAFRTAVLEEGTKWVATSFSPEQAQLLEGRRFSAIQVSNITGVPPHKLGDNSRMAYNSLDAENEAMLDDTYDPWLFRIEDQANEKLLTDEEKRANNRRMKFDRTQLRRMDAATKASVDDKRVNCGLATLNEVRAENNQPPLPAEIGDELRIPTTVTLGPPEPEPDPDDREEAIPGDATKPKADADKAPEGESSPPAEPPKKQKNHALEMAHRALVDDKLARFLAIDKEQLTRAAGREKNFVAWCGDEWYPKQMAKLANALKPVFVAIDAANEQTDGLQAQFKANSFADACYKLALDAWLTACDVPASELTQSLDRCYSDVLPSQWDALVDQIFPGDTV